MKVPWGWLPFTGVVCTLCGMLATMMTQDIWSAHTSMRGEVVVRQLGEQVRGDFKVANQSFTQMETVCQQVDTLVRNRTCATPAEVAQLLEPIKLLIQTRLKELPRTHWWQR